LISKPLISASLLLLGLTFGLAGEAQGGTFNVSPVMFELGPGRGSQVVTITNQGAEPARFQVTLNTWTDGEDGVQSLTPTKELVVFPTLLALPGGAARKIRVGTLKPPAGQGPEKTYRVVMAQIPTEGRELDSGVRMLTNMSLPVFVQPAKPKAALAVASLSVKAGQAELILENRGNSYLRLKKVTVTALGGDGKALVTEDLKAWYLLAGNRRIYPIAFEPGICPQVRTLKVVAESDRGGKVEKTVPVMPFQCEP